MDGFVNAKYATRRVDGDARRHAPRGLRGIQKRAPRGKAGDDDTRGHSSGRALLNSPRSGHECRYFQPLLWPSALEFRAANEVRHNARGISHRGLSTVIARDDMFPSSSIFVVTCLHAAETGLAGI